MRLVIVVLALMLAACADRVETRVTTFHSLTESPRGKTFTVVPLPAQASSALIAGLRLFPGWRRRGKEFLLKILSLWFPILVDYPKEWFDLCQP